MEELSRYLIISLIAVSFTAKVILVFANQGLWWDEAVYMGLGRGVANGFYSLEQGTNIESFRPPLFPFLIFPLSESILAVRLFVVMISAISVIAAYYLTKEMFGKDCALWTSLFLSTSQLFVFFSTKALTEPLFITLVSFSLLFFIKDGKGYKTYALLSGALAGLALITRYLGTILLVAYALYLIFLVWKRSDIRKTLAKYALFCTGLLLAMAPWLALSYAYYGNPLGAYFTNMAIYASSMPSGLFDYMAGFYEFSGPMVVFYALGAYATLKVKRKEKILLLLLFCLPIIFYALAPHKEPRYMLSYAPVYALFSGLALTHKFKFAGKSMQYLAILACAVCLIAGVSFIWNDRQNGEGLVTAANYLKGITEAKGVVMTESYPYTYYFSERRAIRFPENAEDVNKTIESNDIKYVLLYKFEPGNPAYATSYFESDARFSRLMSFGQWGDQEAVVIYKINF